MSRYFLGIDLGGTNLRCLVTDEAARVLARTETDTQAEEGVDTVLERMAAEALRAVADAGLVPEDVSAAAAAVPGPVDSVQGILHSAPNMPGWNSIPVAERLAKSTGMAFFLENDANAAAWGEYWAGTSARGRGDMVLFTVGTGVGGAVILGGKLHEGRDGAAGELGHICVKAGGRRCGCGADGCLEAYASATAIAARYRAAHRVGAGPADLERCEELPDSGITAGSPTCADIFAAAAAGDPLAVGIVERSGYFLGVAAATLANVLNPECCLVAGGVSRAGDLILEPMRRECRRRCYTPGRNMAIVHASLGADAGLFGAAGRAMVRWEGRG